MSDDTQILGTCPNCDKQVTTAWVLVTYEREDGTEGVWAECPACHEVISPE